MKKINTSTLLIAILTPVAVGTLSAFFAGGTSIYSQINKPALAPPGFLFPIVWIILYVLMGVSSYIIYESDSLKKEPALKIYAVQLIFNFFWSIIFFGLNQYFLAFLWLLAMIVFIVIMIYLFYQIEPVAAYLQIPYLLWCLFAAYLNFMIYLLN